MNLMQILCFGAAAVVAVSSVWRPAVDLWKKHTAAGGTSPGVSGTGRLQAAVRELATFVACEVGDIETKMGGLIACDLLRGLIDKKDPAGKLRIFKLSDFDLRPRKDHLEPAEGGEPREL
jgi:hypothetical protein